MESKIWHKWTCLWNKNRLTDIENRLLVPKRDGGGGGKDWEFGTSRCKLLYIGWINNKILLYSTRNYLQYPLIKHNGKEYEKEGTSLVVQWLRIRLPMQGTRVQDLVREDPTCCRATKPGHHNYWAHVPQLLKPARLEPVLRNKTSHCNKPMPAHRNKPPLTTTRESPHAATKTQCSQK